MSGALPPSSDSSAAVPSQQQQQQQQQQEITAAQFSDAIREIIRQQQQQQEITTAQFSDAIREIIRQLQQQQEIKAEAHPWRSMDELRKWLMFVASITASVTYSAALNPPGGFWQADDAAKGHTPGRPVLLDISPTQYNIFFYSNLISFATSLWIIVLGSIRLGPLHRRFQRTFLSLLVTLDIIGCATAFVAGSWTGPHLLVFSICGFVTSPIGLLYVLPWIKIFRGRDVGEVGEALFWQGMTSDIP